MKYLLWFYKQPENMVANFNFFNKIIKNKILWTSQPQQEVDLNSPRTTTLERQTFYCVPVPGESTWVKEISFIWNFLCVQCFLIIFLIQETTIHFFFLISWRLITSQYCSGFCHTLKWISHGFTCVVLFCFFFLSLVFLPQWS